MNAIAQYSSDDEDVVGEKDEEKELKKCDDNVYKICRKQYKSDPQTLRQIPNDNDFFSLSRSSSDSEEADVEHVSKRIKPDRDVVIDEDSGLTVSVPQSSFWNSVSSTDIKHYASRGATCQSEASKMSNPVVSHKSKYGQKHGGKLKEVSRNPTMHGNMELGHNAKIEVPAGTSSFPVLRKLYQVHQKIKPFLNVRRNINRPIAKRDIDYCAHIRIVNKVKWNIPMYSHLILSAAMDNTVRVWNFWTELDSCVQIIKNHNKAVKDAVWSLCGKKILSCSYDKTACLSDVETGMKTATFQHNSFVTCGEFHPENPNVFVTGSHNNVIAWDQRCTAQPMRNFDFNDKIGQIQDIVFTQDGQGIFTCGDIISRDSSDRNIIAWDYKSGAVLSNQIYQERYSCTRLKIHQCERKLLAQSQGGYIAIFSLNKPYKINKSKRFEGHKVDGYGIGFDISTDGSMVYSGGSDGNIYCYNYQSGRLLRTLVTGLDVCMDMAVHPVLPSTLVCCGWNGKIQVWH